MAARLLVVFVLLAGLIGGVYVSARKSAILWAGNLVMDVIFPVHSDPHVRRTSHLYDHIPEPLEQQAIARSVERLQYLHLVSERSGLTLSLLLYPSVHLAGGFSMAARFSYPISYQEGTVTFSGTLGRDNGDWDLRSLTISPDDAASVVIDGALAAQSVPRPDEGADGPQGSAALDAEAADDLGGYHFDVIGATIDRFAKSDARLLDGSSKLWLYGRGLARALRQHQQWDLDGRAIESWRGLEPHSPAAAITEAVYWRNYAWEGRGEGYADQVSAAAGQLFQERLLKARAILDASKGYAASNPLWYSTDMDVLLGLGDVDGSRQAFVEGQQRFPGFYGIYREAVRTQQPRWYGSYDAEDRLIRAAADSTRASLGNSLYTLMYLDLETLETDGNFDLFRDSRVDWSLMQAGFDDLVQRYPNSPWLRNRYANYACRAGDKASFQKIQPSIGPTIVGDAWQHGPSYDECVAGFGG